MPERPRRLRRSARLAGPTRRLAPRIGGAWDDGAIWTGSWIPATKFKERKAVPDVEGAGDPRLDRTTIQQRFDLAVGEFAWLEEPVGEVGQVGTLR